MFSFFNPHPQNKRVRDCVKRAIVKASGKSYAEVSKELNRYKKISGAKTYNEWKNVDPYIENEMGGKRMAFIVQKGQNRMNGGEFCQRFPRGVFLLKMANHLVCVQDGVIFDSWDSSEKCIYVAWRVC